MHSFSLSKLFTLLILIWATEMATYDISLTIPLDKPTVYVDKQLYGDFITLNQSSTLQVNFTKKREDLKFIIFQVHSHKYNITLYKNVNVRGNAVEGTNLGLHSEDSEMEQVNFFVKNSNDFDLKLYVAVHGYNSSDPLAGGCNQEFSVKETPFLRAIHNRNYIYVDAAAPQFHDPDCKFVFDKYVDIYFYMVYLPQQNYDSDVYFDAIVDMMSLKNIKSKRVIPKSVWYRRRMISAYPGTGAVYVAVATKVGESGYSLYVPATSYGCSLTEDDCDLLEDSFSEFMCASLFFIGIFVCFYGHRFFKTQTFIIGFLSGLVVTYIIVAMVKNNLDRPATLALATFSGICIGCSRVVYWWIYGLPVFSIILSSADVGFLISSLVLYVIPDEWSEPFYLNLDLTFWTIFIVIITLVTIALLTINFIANLICCAVIGAYATILPIDYYIGSHMKYILINIERRATVPDYENSMKMMTFQWNDWILACLWLVLAVTGFLFQYHQNKGRPPFPPPPRSVRAVPELPVPVTGSYRRSRINESDGARSLPYNYYTEKTPLLA